MAIETLKAGDEISVIPLNNNFTELRNGITSVSASIATLSSSISSINTNLSSLISQNASDIDDLEEQCDATDELLNSSITRFDNEIEKMKGKPALVPIVNWTELQTKARSGVNVKKTNATTGLEYFDGSTTVLSDSYRTDDILLKEDFTNYNKIMIVFTNASGATFCHTTIWDTWELDYVLSTLPNADVKVDILKNNGYSSTACYWGIYGYNYAPAAYSARTTKKHLMCNSNNSGAGIIEIYGLSIYVVDAYIISGTSPFTSEWLSETSDGEALTPAVGTVYVIKTDGTYKNKTYIWDGTGYKEVSAIIS